MAIAWEKQLEGVTDITRGYKVIDADTHLNEAVDLWTSRAPAKYKDRVPYVKRIVSTTDGFGDPLPEPKTMDKWFIDGDKEFGGMSTVIDRQGNKIPGRAGATTFSTIDEMHPAAWDVNERLKFMDKQGIYAQITYPQIAGFSALKMIQQIP